MRAHDSAGQAPARIQLNTGNVDIALASAAKTVTATTRTTTTATPYRPELCGRRRDADGALIMCNSQDAYVVRTSCSVAQPAAE